MQKEIISWDELNDLVSVVMKGYREKFGVSYSSDWLLIKLREEFGELADVFSFLLLLAQREEIDIRHAVIEKWGEYRGQEKS